MTTRLCLTILICTVVPVVSLAAPNLLTDPGFEQYSGADMFFGSGAGYSYTHWTKPASVDTNPTNNGTHDPAPFDQGTHAPGTNSVHYQNTYGGGPFTLGVQTAVPVPYPASTAFTAAIWFQGGGFSDGAATVVLTPSQLSVSIEVQPVDGGGNPVGPAIVSTITYGASKFSEWFQCIMTGTTPAGSAGVIVRYITNIPALAPGNGAASGMDSAFFGTSLPITISRVDVNPASRVVSGPPYQASFNVTFSGGAAPYTYLWDFGDSQTSGVLAPTHTYAAPGSYPVTITISDAENVASASTFVVAAAGGTPQQVWHRQAVDYDWESGQHPSGAWPDYLYAWGRNGIVDVDYHYDTTLSRFDGNFPYRDLGEVDMYQVAGVGVYLNLYDADWYNYTFDVPADGAWVIRLYIAANVATAHVRVLWDGEIVEDVAATMPQGAFVFVDYPTIAFQATAGTHTLQIDNAGYAPNFTRMEIDYYSTADLPAMESPYARPFTGVDDWSVYQ